MANNVIKLSLCAMLLLVINITFGMNIAIPELMIPKPQFSGIDFKPNIPTIVKITNETNLDYNIYVWDQLVPGVKAPTVRKINVGNEWQDSGFNSYLYIYLGKKMNPETRLVLQLYSDKLLTTLSKGDRDIDSNEPLLDFTKKFPHFLINLNLKGDSLEKSEIEVTGIDWHSL